MPEMQRVKIKGLSLDLNNFRTVPQKNEIAAVDAMISTSPDRFWALADSLLADGYLPTENVIVLRTGPKKLTVKEGNRRIAALKLILGIVSATDLRVPPELVERIAEVTSAWRQANAEVPCTIYDAVDAAIVDRIVKLAHGKGEKAGRDQWTAVARARHNRNENGASEPGLDLLEKYLTNGRNVTSAQAARWAGNYPISVLGEAMKRVAPRFAVPTSPALAAAYPSIPYRDALEKVLHDIGQDEIGFEEVRRPDFGTEYGIPSPSAPSATPVSPSSGGSGATAGPTVAPMTTQAFTPKKPRAIATNDPKSITRALRSFTPRGKNRDKVVALKEEAERLNIEKTPMAFCFLLRSMFEISAKAYAEDHKGSGGPTLKKLSGDDKPLAELLRDITKHLTNNKTDKAMLKLLHGAITELASKDSLLSVTSMNQLVHNPSFSVSATDVATRFAKVFPLLDAMNA